MDSKNKWPNYIRWFWIKPNTTGLIVFLILSIGVSFIIQQRMEIINENEHHEMQSTLENIHQHIELCLKNSFSTALTLALTINDKGVSDDFNFISSELLKSNDCICAVQLVPNGVIKYVYPLEENASALNLDIFKTPNLRKEALQSIATKKMFFAGPFNLKQGGIGIVGRLPVFKKNKFWGFSAVIIKLDRLFKMSGINSMDTNKYYFQFSKINPNTRKEEFFLPVKNQVLKKQQISTTITDGNWKLTLIEKKQNYQYSNLIIPSILGITLAALFGAFITMLLNRPRKLQKLVTIQAEKLLNNEVKFKAIFDRAPVGIALVDDNTGNFIEINNKFCEIIGYSEDEMKTKNYQSITHPKDLYQNELVAEELHTGAISGYQLKKRYITKSGKIILANLIVTALSRSNKKLNTNISIIENITLQKQI